MKASLGLRYLAALCAEGDLEHYVGDGHTSHLFVSNETAAAGYLSTHVSKYGKLPSADTIEIHVDVDLPEVTEPPAYYLEHMKQRYLDRGLRKAVEASVELLKGDNKDPRAAVEEMLGHCIELVTKEKAAHLLDFRQAHDAILSEHVAKVHGENIGVQLGWPYLDEMMGGARQGDLISYVGRPQKGKTWMMLYSALDAWEHQGKTPMFVTHEMSGGLIRERLASLYAHVPAKLLKLGELSPKGIGKLSKSLNTAAAATRPFWIVDAGMATTVPELLAVAQMLKPDVIYLDGAYLIQHDNKRLDRFRKIDEVCEQIKHMLSPMAPTIASYQFNKRVSQKKKDDPVSGDDVYGSDTIFQTSSIMLGIFQPDTPETIHCKLIDVLKGRGGEVGQYRTHWDFTRMDFSQVDADKGKEDEQHQELEFSG